MDKRIRRSAACNRATRTVRISASRPGLPEFGRSRTHREPRRLATHRRRASSYLGEAAAAGAAIADEGAAIAAEGAVSGSLPVCACIDDLVAALAAAFACRLQR